MKFIHLLIFFLYGINANSQLTFTINSSTGNFSITCTNNIINLTANSNYTASPVSYTWISPQLVSTTGTSLTANSSGVYTVTAMAGTLSATQTLSIFQNTTAPGASVTPSPPILTCFSPSLSINALTTATNVSYQWSLTGSVSTNGQTLAVSTTTTAPTNTLYNTCTLTTTNLDNQCTSTFSFSIFRNVFQPTAFISATPPAILGCGINTVVLVNISTTGIPPVLQGVFGKDPVAGFLWQGPPPQQNVSISYSYLAYTPGVYTLTAMDLTNGCKSNTTLNILYDALCTSLGNELFESQFRIYPNPSDGNIYIDSPVNVVVQITDVLGKEHRVFTVDKGKTDIDVTTLPKGVYFCNMQYSHNKIAYKLILR